MKTKNSLLLAFTLAMAPAAAWAADGQVLINQSTIMNAGGFPYTISQPGSYKLSGNLTMTSTAGGNFSGIDIAIIISSSNVTLDFNGFNLILVNNIANLPHLLLGIGSTGFINAVSIQNGAINFTGTGSALAGNYTGIDTLGSGSFRLETFSVFQPGTIANFDRSIRIDKNSILRHVVTNGNMDVACPSVVLESIARTITDPTNGTGCVTALLTAYSAQ